MQLIDLVNVVIIFLSRMILLIMFNFPTGILHCDSHSPVLLDLYISSDASICSAMPFVAWRNSGHVAVLISIDFLPNSKGNVRFHSTAYDYSPGWSL